MDKLISIGAAAELLGVRNTNSEGERSPGDWSLKEPLGTKGARVFPRSILLWSETLKLLEKLWLMPRVSSHDQKDDLERQNQVLELYCATQGWQFEIISDLGSGMNYHKKGLKHLLEKILDGEVSRLVITHKDRLLRFGAELVFAICEAKHVEVVILNRGEDTLHNPEYTGHPIRN